ncbi:serine/arginine-rich splicing factor RS41-like [Galendromus occidentalis]|uniref:Serine/arginine-rich splicing factor RS41-like n=1 Tax=Galendromus occidentalis TaxID=34638 RepID=A0AAJ7WI88_9ACAR|nr:serine/arginine-rich splicing factor RS41-like [Galendromus occidentalis]
MAESSSDSSELRNYLKDLRSRSGGRVSPSRIPRPDPSLTAEQDRAQRPAPNRAAALLDRAANLSRRKEVAAKGAEDSSPTLSLTISSSRKEVAFDLSDEQNRRDNSRSRIPQSPKAARKERETPPLKVVKKSTALKRVLPDTSRHQARRSPSPYHKNCQHSQTSAPDSPEPERGASPKIARSVVTKPGSPRMKASKPSEIVRREQLPADSKGQPGIRRKSRTRRRDESGENDAEAHPIADVSSGSKTTEPSKKSGSSEYSDTFEETTSKLRSTSSRRQTRSRSLDTGLIRSSRSPTTLTTKSSKRSKSSTVPDWWFPGILPPKHLGGDHLEKLQQLHLGVLDDLFRFQIGLIEKHQQRSETRYKWINDLVKSNHAYTTWDDYQSDPRARFFSWQKEAATADLPQ